MEGRSIGGKREIREYEKRGARDRRRGKEEGIVQ